MTDLKKSEELELLRFEDVVAHIDKHWTSKSCIKCSSNGWTVGQDDQAIASIPIVGFNGRDAMFLAASRVLPLVWLMCNTCGYVEFLSANAVRAGKNRAETGHE